MAAGRLARRLQCLDDAIRDDSFELLPRDPA
jgi:hypothetical protein